jgi:aspartate carbamoyltransferase
VKGETLSDTIKCLGCYSDAVVLRHPVKGSAAEASAACPVPVLNAGDGVGEHPSQALLDVYTMQGELGRLEGIHVVLVGDLKNGRTVHSLSRLLALWPGVRLTYVAPPELAMPEGIVQELQARGVQQETAQSLDDSVVSTADVIYVTRVQKERFSDPAEYERLKHAYVVTAATLTAAKERMVVMHPLPRVGEIAVEVDADPRAAYFRQMQYGLYMRMALLALVLGKSKEMVASCA